MRMGREPITCGLAVLLSLLSWSAAAQGQEAVSPADEALARQHLDALCDHLEKIEFGAFSFLVEQKSEVFPNVPRERQVIEQTAGRYQFDFPRDMESCNMLDRASCSTYWVRNEEVVFMIENRDRFCGVLMYERDMIPPFFPAYMPFDFREMPIIGSGFLIVPKPVAFQSPREGFEMQKIIAVETDGARVHVTIQNKEKTIREVAENLPEKYASLKEQILKVLDEGKRPGVLRGRTMLSFDRNQLGVVTKCRRWVSGFEREDWQQTSSAEVTWDMIGETFVPSQVICDMSARGDDKPANRIEVSLTWDFVNDRRDQLQFTPDAVEALHGRPIYDTRLPDNRQVGIVGHARLPIRVPEEKRRTEKK